jgi:hypothetical protein
MANPMDLIERRSSAAFQRSECAALSWVILDDRWKSIKSQLLEVNFLAGIVDVDAHQITSDIVIQDDAFRDLSAIDARLLRKVDIE